MDNTSLELSVIFLFSTWLFISNTASNKKKKTINLQNIVIQYLFAVTSSLLSIVYGSNMLSENATYIVMSPIFNYILILYVSYAVSMSEEDI